MEPTGPDVRTSALEQSFLQAAKGDQIPTALSARMADALGVQAGAGAALAHSAQSSQGSLAVAAKGTPFLLKASLWGTLSVAVIATGYQLTRPEPQPTPQHAAQADAQADTPAKQAAPLPTPSQEPAQAPAAEVAPVVAPVAAPRASAAVLAPTPDAALRAEIALLDRARASLRGDQPARTLRLLDQHARRFSHPTLAPEAAALRIEALSERGEHARAEALSQGFLQSYPSHPLRDHVAGVGAAQRSQPAR
jgi:hypothetical protein